MPAIFNRWQCLTVKNVLLWQIYKKTFSYVPWHAKKFLMPSIPALPNRNLSLILSGVPLCRKVGPLLGTGLWHCPGRRL